MIEQGHHGVVKVTRPNHDYFGHTLYYDDDRPAVSRCGWEALCLTPGGEYMWIAPWNLEKADDIAAARFRSQAIGHTKALLALGAQ